MPKRGYVRCKGCGEWVYWTSTVKGLCLKCQREELKDKQIADNMRSYWANLNAGSADWRG